MLSRTWAVAVALACLAASTASAAPPVANTTYGAVSGAVDPETSVWVWHSIPFAAPPVGNLRYAPPTPPEPWQGVKDASSPPNECAQADIVGLTHSGDEDCLYLHVYTPKQGQVPGAKLPVMVWIYGGGFIAGTSSMEQYDGTYLASKYGVIVVAMNYRLGPFGFLSLPALAAETKNGTTGNYGPQDQQAALRWVAANIGNFGGDPEQVTIFGESAGGFSVCWHLQSPGSKGLFRAAIMESGNCDSPGFFYGKQRAVEWSVEWAAAAGCDGNSSTTEEIVECLRGKSTQEVMLPMARELNSHWPFASSSGREPTYMPAMAPIMPWGPTIDGAWEGCKGKPIDMFRKGKDYFNAVPVIFGTNLNEGTIFSPAVALMTHSLHIPPTEADVEAALAHVMGGGAVPGGNNATAVKELVAAIVDMYPASAFENNWERVGRIITEWFFFCGTKRSALAIAATGTPAHLYHFTFPEGTSEWKVFGVTHGTEVKYVFQETNKVTPTPLNQTMMDYFGGYWTNFAKTMDPNGGVPAAGEAGVTTGLLNWPTIGTPDSYSHINLTVPLGVESNNLKQRCDFWDNWWDVSNGWA